MKMTVIQRKHYSKKLPKRGPRPKQQNRWVWLASSTRCLLPMRSISDNTTSPRPNYHCHHCYHRTPPPQARRIAEREAREQQRQLQEAQAAVEAADSQRLYEEAARERREAEAALQKAREEAAAWEEKRRAAEAATAADKVA